MELVVLAAGLLVYWMIRSLVLLVIRRRRIAKTRP
jgi:hypothetical protein